MKETAQEKKDKQRAALVTAGIQVVLFLVIFLVIAWSPPDPPNPEYGIELNFGVTNAGSGDVQPERITTASETPQEENRAEAPSVTEATPEPVPETQVETEAENTAEPEDTTPNTADSPDVRPAETAETNPVTAEEDPAEETPARQEPVVEEPPKEETKPAETKPEENKPDASAGTPATGRENNESEGNGNTTKKGDQGSQEGKLDERGLMGNEGGGTGSSLQMAGWKWEEKPELDDKSTVSGTIVFSIEVDEEGYLLGEPKVLQSTVPASVVAVYRRAVERLSFVKTSGYAPSPSSKGKIIFTIKAK